MYHMSIIKMNLIKEYVAQKFTNLQIQVKNRKMMISMNQFNSPKKKN